MKIDSIIEIDFTEKFDCIVCLNADIPQPSIFAAMGGAVIIAADGAAHKLADIGIIPDWIIGDLDSFDSSDTRLAGKSKIICNPDQEINDFEKILGFAIENRFQRILVTGFHGGELEHTLNNWSVFMRFALKLNLCIYDKGRYAIAASKSFSIETYNNEIISLIPQPVATLTTHNLKWALNNEELKLGRREGTRNRAIADNIRIEIHSGELLVFFDSKIPFAPVVPATQIL